MTLKPKDPDVYIYSTGDRSWGAWNSRTRKWLRLESLDFSDAVKEYERRSGRRWYK